MARRQRDDEIAAQMAAALAGPEPADTTTPNPAGGPAAAAAPATPAQGAFPSGRRMVTAYLDAAEAAELEARAAAEERSVSFLVRRAVRAYLGLG